MADQNNQGGDGRGRVTDPETDQRVGNKSGNMGRSFKENPELAAEAGRKGGESSGGGGGGNRGGGRQMGQKEAVWNALTEVLGADQFDGPVHLEGDQRERIKDILVQQFVNGEITYGGDLPDEKKLRTYTTGLISNWLRKDSRLNGNQKYQPKNPGSRAGTGDETLKALKSLLAITKEADGRREIEEEIARRQEQLRPKRDIKVDAIPEHLRKYLPQQG